MISLSTWINYGKVCSLLDPYLVKGSKKVLPTTTESCEENGSGIRDGPKRGLFKSHFSEPVEPILERNLSKLCRLLTTKSYTQNSMKNVLKITDDLSYYFFRLNSFDV